MLGNIENPFQGAVVEYAKFYFAIFYYFCILRVFLPNLDENAMIHICVHYVCEVGPPTLSDRFENFANILQINCK